MADMPDPSSFLDRLINSRNRDLSLFLPFIMGFTTPDTESDPDSENPNPPRDRIILINPWTQGIVIIEGRSSSSSLDSLLRDLMGKEGQPPASTASIEALPRVEIKEGDEGECVICLEEWGRGDVAKEMPCKHRFHGGCVEKWLKVHGTCPVCRYKMPVVEDDDLGKNGQTMESNERESGERGRERREIWVSFSIRDEEEEGSRSQRGSLDESNDSSS